MQLLCVARKHPFARFCAALIRLSVPFLLALCALLLSPEAKADRLGDMCDVVGVRENQLIGYGVVTGLNGTGDDVSAPFATQSLLALMRRMGVQIDKSQFRLKNVAAVLVTATLPPFARPGAHLDVTVSSVGNSKSLRGGILLQTPLYGGDQRVYAVAQGSLVTGGFGAQGGSGTSVQRNSTTAARVPAGALVERTVPTQYTDKSGLTLALRQPDFITSQRVANAINTALGAGSAHPLDGGAVQVTPPSRYQGHAVELMSVLNELDVTPSLAARVIINERTGTIIAGGDVRLSPVAISHGGLTIVIRESPQVSQPNPLSPGTTTTTQQSAVQVNEDAQDPAMAYLEGATSLADVARTMTSLGVSPRDMASILQAMRAAGALRAEVIVQ